MGRFGGWIECAAHLKKQFPANLELFCCVGYGVVMLSCFLLLINVCLLYFEIFANAKLLFIKGAAPFTRQTTTNTKEGNRKKKPSISFFALLAVLTSNQKQSVFEFVCLSHIPFKSQAAFSL